ncbi:GIY-YIG nuclease family protein [Patescibacteria group bacterium]|jgi:putative endonuclease|nr:GIY-YIG nuclease family protein [Patescibacteria group bacterium]
MRSRSYCVYILTNRLRSVLYIGVTGNLEKRLYEHRNKIVAGFTLDYQISILLYFEETDDVRSAIEREKQLKRWSRIKKEWLIGLKNPRWNDLSEKL